MRLRGWLLMASAGLLGTLVLAAGAVCFTSGCSTLPNAIVFTRDCTATGTTSDSSPITTE